jgi:hypothetical protein
MKKSNIQGNTSDLNTILYNIEQAELLSKENNSVKMVIVVSGNDIDRVSWQQRLDRTCPSIFNRDKSTKILSIEERIGEKTREGNFLGTLLAYNKMKVFAEKENISYRDSVVLMGMLFGRGERMSPFTQIEGDRKPAIIVSSGVGVGNWCLTALEEALFYFTPVVKYLESRGFKGILDKWGDETEIPSIDLTTLPDSPDDFACFDVIKFISMVKITDELAKQKDWTVVDDEKNILCMLARNEKSFIVEQLKECCIEPGPDNEYYAGVSLGPVAVSYEVLDIATEVFKQEIIQEGVTIDFDPYFLMALSLKKDVTDWEKTVQRDRGLQALLAKVPDFLEKVQKIKVLFAQRYGRTINFRAIDFGDRVYWADIGLHHAMREKYLSLLNEGQRGIIARKLEHIDGEKDEFGNRIIDSTISDGIVITDSVVINSTLTGRGIIRNSVVKDSILHNPSMMNAFAVLSMRLGEKIILNPGSGIYRSIGKGELELDEGMRHGTLVSRNGPIDLKVSEKTDLRDREHTYLTPIFGNTISFAEAYDMMFGVSKEELEEMRKKLIDRLMAKKNV